MHCFASFARAANIKILKKILNKKNEWFIQKEIGDILLETGKIEEAKRYYIDAALNNGPSEMKIKLFWNLADIFEKKNMIEEEKQHRIFVLGLRQVYGWKLSSIESEFKKTIPEKLLNGFNYEAFFPDYTMSGTTDILAYIASAIIGVALLIIIFKILGSIIYAKKQSL